MAWQTSRRVVRTTTWPVAVMEQGRALHAWPRAAWLPRMLQLLPWQGTMRCLFQQLQGGLTATPSHRALPASLMLKTVPSAAST